MTCSCSDEHHDRSRRDFLRLVGAAGAGVVLLGATSGEAMAREGRPRRRLGAEFERAAREFDVSADVLMAEGWVNTRWRMPPPEANVYRPGEPQEGAPHSWGSYGMMSLVQNPSSDTLGEASRLTGMSEATLKTNRAANIRGGAALLAAATGSRKPRRTQGFFDALAGEGRGQDFDAVSGVGAGEEYAEEVLWAVENGITQKLRAGEKVEVGTRDLSSDADERSGSAVRRKPSVLWHPAHRSNYTRANRPRSHRINRIVIHSTQGTWGSAIRWFRNSVSNVSAHYVIRSRDGRIAQCLSDRNICWHSGNWPVNRGAIGIEHEAFFDEPVWYTKAMYHSSARLVAYLCRRYGIPPTSRRIIGHNRASSTRCPGPYWSWNHYMSLVARYWKRPG